MAQYRCYFFDTGKAISGAEDIEADGDEDAEIRARDLYRKRPNQIYGFEVWQGARLVRQNRSRPSG